MDWAISKVGDVKTFFERKENPNFSKIQVVMNQKENDYLVDKGLIFKSGDDYTYSNGASRREVISEARESQRIHKSLPGAETMNLWFGYIPLHLQKEEMACLNAIAGLYQNSKEMVVYLDDQYRYQPTLLDKTAQKIIPKLHGVDAGQIMSYIYDSICCTPPMPQIVPRTIKYGAQLVIEELGSYKSPYDLDRLLGALDNYQSLKKELNKLRADKVGGKDLDKAQSDLNEAAEHLKEFNDGPIPFIKHTYHYPLQGKVSGTAK